MNEEYLTIIQASNKYDRSYSTITRFARENKKSKFVKIEKRKFLISDAFLAITFQTQPVPKKDNTVLSNLENKSELLFFLKSENDFLKNQIAKKDNQIDKLLEK